MAHVMKSVEIMPGIKALKGLAINAIARAKRNMPVDAIASEARDEVVTTMIPEKK